MLIEITNLLRSWPKQYPTPGLNNYNNNKTPKAKPNKPLHCIRFLFGSIHSNQPTENHYKKIIIWLNSWSLFRNSDNLRTVFLLVLLPLNCPWFTFVDFIKYLLYIFHTIYSRTCAIFPCAHTPDAFSFETNHFPNGFRRIFAVLIDFKRKTIELRVSIVHIPMGLVGNWKIGQQLVVLSYRWRWCKRKREREGEREGCAK